MKRSIFNWIIILAAASAAVVTILALCGWMKFYRIPTKGMSRTVKPGDLVFSTGGLLAPSDYKRGQIVIFRPPHSPKNRYIQRVVAIPGDRIEVVDGKLAVNGTVLTSPEGHTSTPPISAHRLPGFRMPEYPLAIPEGQMFLMGDNFNNSLDSRYFGPVEMKRVTHVPRAIAFPPSRAGGLK
jgi:signal peptidase I